MLIIHIDDWIMTSLPHALVQEALKSKYAWTNLGAINWLLGIKITQDHKNQTISLLQFSSINSLLKWFNFTDLKPFLTSMDLNIQNSKPEVQCPQTLEQSMEMHHIPYLEAVGLFWYLAVAYILYEKHLFCMPSLYYHFGTQARAPARSSLNHARLWAQGWAWVLASLSLLEPGTSLIPKKVHEHKSHHISTSFAPIMKRVGALESSQKVGPNAFQNAQYKRVWIVWVSRHSSPILLNEFIHRVLQWILVDSCVDNLMT